MDKERLNLNFLSMFVKMKKVNSNHLEIDYFANILRGIKNHYKLTIINYKDRKIPLQ